MIGQVGLQSRIKQMIENDTFPRFSIIVGPKGSGKKTLLNELFEGIYLEDNKVDSVRKMIEMVYKIGNQTFIMPDADTMSNAAKNALLKVIEECPNNNYFIMTLEDANNTLDTIRSRGAIFHMVPYTKNDLFEYGTTISNDKQAIDYCIGIADNPGEMNKLIEYGTLEFADFISLVCNNIDKTSLANAFKIGDKIALKNDADGYDLKLFWKAFNKECMNRVKQNILYAGWSIVTSRHLSQLVIKSINKKMLFDKWIMEIRDYGESY